MDAHAFSGLLRFMPHKRNFAHFAIPLLSAVLSSTSFAAFEGTYWIENVGTNDNLRIPDLELYSNLQTVPATTNGTWTQWEFVPNGSYYHIRNSRTGNYIRPRTGNDLSPIYSVPNSWTGHWTQWSIESLSSGNYRFVNRETGKHMGPDSANDFAAVTQKPSNDNGNNTAWELNLASDIESDRFSELENHIRSVNSMTIAELQAWTATFLHEAGSLYTRPADFAAATQLVELYEDTMGPLFTSEGQASFPASWEDEENLERALARAVFSVYQGILDSTNSQLIASSPELVDGLMFRSTENFPGSVPNPSNTTAAYDVRIDASLPEEFGSIGGYDTNAARRMTGAYLAPGSIAEVIVPQSLVNNGYSIRVGGHSWDLSNKPNVNRLYRVSKTFDITGTVTKVANPMGGNIYIEVPVGADKGIVNVQFRNTIRAPFFSARGFDETSRSDWENVERNHPGSFTDIESEHSMWTVPTKWIGDLGYDELNEIIDAHDENIQVASEYVGKNSSRHKAILYMIVDTQIRGRAFSIGYPQSNYGSFSQDTIRSPITVGNAFNKVLWHEHGHAELVTMFVGEAESHVHMLALAIGMENYGFTLQEAFSESLAYGPNEHTTSDALSSWVIMDEFIDGQNMQFQQASYRPRGHGNYAEYIELFGLDAMKNFNRKINIEMDGRSWDEWTAGDNGRIGNNARINHNYNDRILRLSREANANVAPLFHLWGHAPSNLAELQSDMEAEGLQPSTQIYDRMIEARNSVPLTQSEWDSLFSRMGEFLNNSRGPWEELNENYDVERGRAAVARIDELIELYFPEGRPENVVFHANDNFQGASFTGGVGVYTIADIKNTLVGNDAISSIQIPQGLSVTVYQHSNAGGRSATYTTSMPTLGTFNNITSHIVVSRR